MKVLWFSIHTSLYNTQRDERKGGGWIDSLEHIVTSDKNIQLAIAFIENKGNFGYKKTSKNKVKYYSMDLGKFSFVQKFKSRFTNKIEDELTVLLCKQVIDDFNPDIIQIFGSEWCFGLINNYKNIPVIIHMQGMWGAIVNAQLPPAFSLIDEYIHNWFNPKKIFLTYAIHKKHLDRAAREEKVLSSTKYFMGRTRWDYALTRLYAPKSKYFLCQEGLRPEITNYPRKWQLKTSDSLMQLVTTGSGTSIKGYDLVLKTAKILKKYADFDFKWNLIGVTPEQLKCMENKTGIKSLEVNLCFLGKKSAIEVAKILEDSDIYVHASYIDNSPNAICEAQYLGLPVIATNVGGIPSLFSSDYPSDLLVPTNDPFYLASKIIMIFKNKELLQSLSNSNLSVSMLRHDEEQIKKQLLNIYKDVLKMHKR